MEPKIIKSEKEASALLAAGAQELTDAVTSTLGPLSYNVAIERGWMVPHVVHDGVTVAGSIFFKDRFKNMGAMLIKDAAALTNQAAGDGTTTATLLANTLFQAGLKLIQGKEGMLTSGVKPMRLRKSLLLQADVITEKLMEMRKEMTTDEEAQQIAIISAQNEEIGKLVAEAVKHVGKDGIIMVENGDPGDDSGVETNQGMMFDNGFLSPLFMNFPARGSVEYQDCYVLLTDMKITNADDLAPIITKIFEGDPVDKKPLLVIADDVVGPAIQAMVKTYNGLGHQMVAVCAPDYGERRREALEDIAVLTGAELLTHDLGISLKDVKIGQLGKIRTLKVTWTHTYLTPSNPDPDEIADRVGIIKTQIKDETNTVKKGRLEERLARLSDSVAIITVGGGSEIEIKEKRERFIDAIGATKSALAEGVIPGGGMALMRIAQELKKLPEPVLGQEIVIEALEAPFRKIMENSGVDADRILTHLIEEGGSHEVYDVMSEKFVDPYKEGILDPVKVTRLAIKHAFSVASTMLTTNHLIANDVDDNVQQMKIVQ